MANLSIPAASVVPNILSTTQHYQPGTLVAGEAIAAGEFVCLLAADGKAYKADADDVDKRNVLGMAGNSAAAAGQRVDVISLAATCEIGAHGIAVGVPYYLAATAGKICPYGDLASGALPILCAFTNTATAIQIVLASAGAAKP